MINTIQIKFNLITRVFSIIEGGIDFVYGNDNDPIISFYYGFVGEEKNIVFKNLSFGIEIKNDLEEVIFTRTWPNDGSTYISSDQEFLQTFQIGFKSNKTYKVSLYVNEGFQFHETTYDLSIPEFEVFPDYEVE